jgi:hypothetical protein
MDCALWQNTAIDIDWTQQNLSNSDLHANNMAQNVLLETSMGSIVVELYNHAPKVSVNGIVPRYCQ